MYDNCEMWNSPDGLISKVVTKKGTWGPKPSEACECVIFISQVQGGSVDLERYNNASVTIGDMDTNFGRLLSNALLTMLQDETADFKFQLDTPVQFKLHLKSFIPKGAIYEWDAKQKYERALYHKGRGVQLFPNSNSEASHHFAKALKLLASIPIEIDEPPEEKDGIPIIEIEKLHANLCNNLASCHLKNENYDNVIHLCQKVLDHDSDNEKALYKLGVAYFHEREFEHAYSSLRHLLKLDPDNKPALDRMNLVKIKLRDEDRKSKQLAKRMFGVFDLGTGE